MAFLFLHIRRHHEVLVFSPLNLKIKFKYISIFSLIEMGMSCARMEQNRSTFKILTGTLTGKRPLGRSRHRLEDNIRIRIK